MIFGSIKFERQADGSTQTYVGIPIQTYRFGNCDHQTPHFGSAISWRQSGNIAGARIGVCGYCHRQFER